VRHDCSPDHNPHKVLPISRSASPKGTCGAGGRWGNVRPRRIGPSFQKHCVISPRRRAPSGTPTATNQQTAPHHAEQIVQPEHLARTGRQLSSSGQPSRSARPKPAGTRRTATVRRQSDTQRRDAGESWIAIGLTASPKARKNLCYCHVVIAAMSGRPRWVGAGRVSVPNYG